MLDIIKIVYAGLPASSLLEHNAASFIGEAVDISAAAYFAAGAKTMREHKAAD